MQKQTFAQDLGFLSLKLSAKHKPWLFPSSSTHFLTAVLWNIWWRNVCHRWQFHIFAFFSMPGTQLRSISYFEILGASIWIDWLLLALRAMPVFWKHLYTEKENNKKRLKMTLVAKNTADRNREFTALFCRLTCALGFIIGLELPDYAEGYGWVSIISLLLASPQNHKRLHRCCKIHR